MHNEYDDFVSFHYAKYRPPLHKPLLGKCLHPEVTFAFGLDVGCGTGHSSIALSHYCDKVIGLDPSRAMIERAIEHPKVEYIAHAGMEYPFDSESFDVISFAGSLYYSKSQVLLDEVLRVGKDSAKVIVYDFKIDLEEILAHFNIGESERQNSEYNHEEDFSGLLNTQLKKQKTSKERVTLNINPSELVHLVLSAKDNYLMLKDKFGIDCLDHSIKSSLVKFNDYSLQATTYYSLYHVQKKKTDYI